MLVVKNISKNFGIIQALSNVSFSLKKGETAVLLGENGAGKSTLLRLVCGYLDPSAGEIALDKMRLADNRSDYLLNIGYVQEVSALYSEMTTAEFLEFAANLRKLPKETISGRVKEAVLQLELAPVMCQRLETLSKGFKKRAELAAVLLAQPEVLLLDEPTEGLDPLQKESIRKIIKTYAKKHIVIISTHVLEDAEALATRVLLLHQGKLAVDAPLAEFKKTAKNNLLESFKKVTGV